MLMSETGSAGSVAAARLPSSGENAHRRRSAVAILDVEARFRRRRRSRRRCSPRGRRRRRSRATGDPSGIAMMRPSGASLIVIAYSRPSSPNAICLTPSVKPATCVHCPCGVAHVKCDLAAVAVAHLREQIVAVAAALEFDFGDAREVPADDVAIGADRRAELVEPDRLVEVPVGWRTLARPADSACSRSRCRPAPIRRCRRRSDTSRPARRRAAACRVATS